jgi:hypothetical protein
MTPNGGSSIQGKLTRLLLFTGGTALLLAEIALLAVEAQQMSNAIRRDLAAQADIGL